MLEVDKNEISKLYLEVVYYNPSKSMYLKNIKKQNPSKFKNLNRSELDDIMNPVNSITDHTKADDLYEKSVKKLINKIIKEVDSKWIAYSPPNSIKKASEVMSVYDIEDFISETIRYKSSTIQMKKKFNTIRDAFEDIKNAFNNNNREYIYDINTSNLFVDIAADDLIDFISDEVFFKGWSFIKEKDYKFIIHDIHTMESMVDYIEEYGFKDNLDLIPKINKIKLKIAYKAYNQSKLFIEKEKENIIRIIQIFKNLDNPDFKWTDSDLKLIHFNSLDKSEEFIENLKEKLKNSVENLKELKTQITQIKENPSYYGYPDAQRYASSLSLDGFESDDQYEDRMDREAEKNAHREEDYYGWNQYHKTPDNEFSRSHYDQWEKNEKEKKHKNKWISQPKPFDPLEKLKSLMRELKIEEPNEFNAKSVKKAHRQIINKLHPDKYTNPSDKKWAHDQFINYNNDIWDKLPENLKESVDIFNMVYEMVMLNDYHV